MLTKRLSYDFYDIDDEVKKLLGITLEEFVSIGRLYERDALRCELVNSILNKKGDKVIAITPLSYIYGILHIFSLPDVLSIELFDSVENIFDRLVFSDENDNVYKDDYYKNKHKEHYLSDIKHDIDFYGGIYSKLMPRFDIEGCSIEETADRLIKNTSLTKRANIIVKHKGISLCLFIYLC